MQLVTLTEADTVLVDPPRTAHVRCSHVPVPTGVQRNQNALNIKVPEGTAIRPVYRPNLTEKG